MSDSDTHAVPAEARRLVERFFETLSGMRAGEFMDLWHEDGVFEQPYAPEGFPARLEGAEAIHRHVEPMPRVFATFAYHDLDLHATEDPELYVCTVSSTATVLATGKPYENRYVIFFRVREGRIALYREFYDPLVVLESFGSADTLNAAFGVR
jgi:uncharacterized protein